MGLIKSNRTRAAVSVAAALAVVVEISAFLSPSPVNLKPFTVSLIHGDLICWEFPAKRSSPLAIVLFGSGDGGWSAFEEGAAKRLQADGYEVIGIECPAYAHQDYDLKTLQADYTTIAIKARAEFPFHPPPIILGGYSMGAAQAIAAAGGPNPPPGLVGLVVIDPLSRGRYGLRLQDRTNILPTGDGTFALSDFASNFKNLRIVQWHGTNDQDDCLDWLKGQPVSYREEDLIGSDHFYSAKFDEFLKRLGPSLDWILDLEKQGAAHG